MGAYPENKLHIMYIHLHGSYYTDSLKCEYMHGRLALGYYGTCMKVKVIVSLPKFALWLMVSLSSFSVMNLLDALRARMVGRPARVSEKWA